MRLNHFISKSGYVSRRKADCLIKEGRVKINSEVIYQPFFDVSLSDRVEVEGKILGIQQFKYILFNKPEGVTVTLSDKFALKTVKDFFPDLEVYPVGRLDKNSSGLLLLTNDGQLCYQLTHPRFCVEKEYLLTIKGVLTVYECRRAQKGIKCREDLLKVDKVIIDELAKDKTYCRVVTHEGKKRHLRRLFRQMGFAVQGLHRARIGNLLLGSLKPGEHRELDRKEIYQKCLMKNSI